MLRTGTRLSKATLLTRRWPSTSVAHDWLKQNRYDLDKLDCSIGMADDEGVCLFENGHRTSVGLPLGSRQERDDAIILEAEYFTTFRFGGRGIRDRREFETLLEAATDASGDHRAMVYAVHNKVADAPISQNQIQRYLVLRGEAPMVTEVVAGGVYQKRNGDLAQVVLTRSNSLVVLYQPLGKGTGRRLWVCDAGETFACKFEGPLPKGFEKRLRMQRK